MIYWISFYWKQLPPAPFYLLHLPSSCFGFSQNPGTQINTRLQLLVVPEASSSTVVFSSPSRDPTRARRRERPWPTAAVAAAAPPLPPPASPPPLPPPALRRPGRPRSAGSLREALAARDGAPWPRHGAVRAWPPAVAPTSHGDARPVPTDGRRHGCPPRCLIPLLYVCCATGNPSALPLHRRRRRHRLSSAAPSAGNDPPLPLGTFFPRSCFLISLDCAPCLVMCLKLTPNVLSLYILADIALLSEVLETARSGTESVWLIALIQSPFPIFIWCFCLSFWFHADRGTWSKVWDVAWLRSATNGTVVLSESMPAHADFLWYVSEISQP